MSAPSAQHRLPDSVDPYQLARAGEVLQGELDGTDMDRLRSLLHGTMEPVSLQLRFSLSQGRLPVISGHVRARLPLLCQRCLETTIEDIDASFSLGVIRGEGQLAQLPEDLEPLILEQDKLTLSSLIEDELLLSLPLVAMHQPEQCAVRLEPTGNRQGQAEEEPRKNPFAVLESLKKE